VASDLRVIVLASLVAVPSAFVFGSCILSCAPKPFELDEVVDKKDLERHLKDSAAEMNCERVCEIVQGSHHHEVTRLDSCELEIVSPEAVHVTCSGNSVFVHEGRRPFARLEHDRPWSPGTPLGATLAELAYLEAASVLAFTELADQLARLGAPAELRDRCLAAAEDERRHASLLGALARQHGVTPREPRAHDREPPPLVELARHNAVEGCVFESFAALLAVVRSLTAADETVRMAYGSIAEDELRHGQLAWDIHAWACAQLDARARASVHADRERAIATLPAHARALSSMPPALQRLRPDAAEQLAHEFASRIAAA
jgi:hypothetical protein